MAATGLNLKNRKKGGGKPRGGKNTPEASAGDFSQPKTLKQLDESVLKELEGSIPKTWIGLIGEIFTISRPYAGLGVEAIVQNGDFNRLIADKMRLSALNIRLSTIAGLMTGRHEVAHHARKSGHAKHYYATLAGEKMTDKSREQKAEIDNAEARIKEGKALGAANVCENLMHRTNGIVHVLEVACNILQREMARAGEGED